MGFIRRIALAVLAISFVVFVALFGRLPALRATPIGFLHRLLLHKLPGAIRHVDKRTTGGRLTSASARFGHYLMNERHPLVLIFYLSLLTGSATIFLSTAWTRFPAFPHHILIPILVSGPYVFTYLAATSTASRIKVENHAKHLRTYPFDHTLYDPDIKCRTCAFTKPARSKHCPLCRACVARHDHHCVWVNTCIGKDNYRWFMCLLASLGVLLTYGAYLAITLLRLSRAFLRPAGRNGLRGFFDQFATALSMDVRVGAVGLLAALTAPLAWVMFFYHVYLIWAGMTTNETSKWASIRYGMEDGAVWKGKRAPESRKSESDAEWSLQSDQVVVMMQDDKHPSTLKQRNVVKGSWEQCWSLDDLDNLYDLGFWRNLKDAMQP